jgi:L-amino acid N-acyltransferase YncA
MSLTVRPMVEADVPQACAILNEIIAQGGTTAFEEPFTEQQFSDAYIHGADLICCHVVLDGTGEVAGFQWVGVADSLPSDCANIASFTRRDPPLRGAGRALFPVTCEFARGAGFTQINATIRADNVPGLGYYSSVGFVDFDVARDVPLRDGTRVDRVSKRFKL